MKTILFFALLAFATQAHDYFGFDLPEIYRGAVSNLHLSTEQKNKLTNDGLDCIHLYSHILHNFFSSVKTDIKTKNIQGVVQSILSLGKILEGNIEPKCIRVFETLDSLVQKHSRPINDPNYPMYLSIMIQLAGEAVKNLVQQQFYHSGESLGTIFQIYYGMLKPNLPQVEELDFDKWVRFDEDSFIRKFSSEIAKTLVKDQAAADRTGKCVLNVVHTYKRVFSNNDLHSSSTSKRLLAFSEAITSLYEAVKVPECQDGLVILKRILTPFGQNPLYSLLMMASNFVMNNPTVLQQYMNLVIYALHGQYELSGQAAGNEILTLLNGISF